jgi:hypothetical protein
MSFGIGVICYIVGSILVGICIVAIPGPGGEAAEEQGGHGHGAH